MFDSFQKLQSRYCNRTGRPGNKNVGIVKKLLPLQPKTNLTIVQTSNFRPILPAVSSEQDQATEEVNHEMKACNVDDVVEAPPSPKSKYKRSFKIVLLKTVTYLDCF